MEQIFEEAHAKRRSKEYILTSGMTNCIYYGSPAYARKANIWPPLSEQSPLAGSGSGGSHLGQTRNLENAAPEVEALSTSISARVGQAGEFDDACSPVGTLTTDRTVLYQPLHEGQIIRVLELQPGLPEEPLRGNFHYTDLRHSHLQYFALSYVWGGDQYFRRTKHDMECSILLQDDAFEAKITRNLDQALRHIRLVSEAMLIWTDAVCIRQDDKREQGHQVSLMGSVYKSAEKVIIWLGQHGAPTLRDKKTYERLKVPPEFEDVRAQRALGAVCELVNGWLGPRTTLNRACYSTSASLSASVQVPECHTGFSGSPPAVETCADPKLMQQMLNKHYPDPPGSKEAYDHSKKKQRLQIDRGIDSHSDEASRSQIWSSIRDLYTNPWFWRVWVIQEAVLAKRAVVRWANTWIDWHWIGLAAALLRTNHQEVCEKLRLSGVYNAYLMYRLSPSSDLPPPDLSFMDLLRLTRQFDVTDPRDRVYGLLGMKTKHNDPDAGTLFIQPDYTITSNQLWIRLVWKFIRTARNLSILSSVQYTTGNYDSQSIWRGQHNGQGRYFARDSDGNIVKDRMCSWVPNWDHVYRTTLSPWDRSERFAAASGFPLQLENDMSSNTAPDQLNVHGYQVGLVGFEGLYMWRELDTSLLFTKHLGRFLASIEGIHILAQTFTAGRNSYGSLSGSSEQATSDFAAYLLMINQNANHEESTDDTTAAEAEDIYQESDFFRFHKRHDQPITRKNLQRVFNAHPGLEEELRARAKNGDAERFLATAITVCERRRLFLTLNGYLGLGSDTAREGDILVVLSGADVPYLLRPVSYVDKEDKPTKAISSSPIGNDSDSDSDDIILSPPSSPEADNGSSSSPANSTIPKEAYILIGECYVPGLMEGEAVRAANHHEELVGPVPTDLIVAQILAQANMPEEVPRFAPIDEMQRTREKLERLQRGNRYTSKPLEGFMKTNPERKVFNIS